MNKDPLKELLAHEMSQQRRFENSKLGMAEEIENARQESADRISVAESEVKAVVDESVESAKQKAQNDLLRVKREFEDRSRRLDRNIDENLDMAVEKVFTKVIKDVQS